MDWNSAGQKSVSQQTAVTHLWTMDILGEEKKKKITIPRAGRNLVHGGVEWGRERTKRDFRTDFLENLCFSYTAGCFVFLYKQKGSFLHISKSLLTPWAIGDGGTERGREKEMCVAAQKPWVTQTSGCTWTWPSPVASLRHLSWGLQVLPQPEKPLDLARPLIPSSSSPTYLPYEFLKGFLFFPQGSEIALFLGWTSVYEKVNPAS